MATGDRGARDRVQEPLRLRRHPLLDRLAASTTRRRWPSRVGADTGKQSHLLPPQPGHAAATAADDARLLGRDPAPACAQEVGDLVLMSHSPTVSATGRTQEELSVHPCTPGDRRPAACPGCEYRIVRDRRSSSSTSSTPIMTSSLSTAVGRSPDARRHACAPAPCHQRRRHAHAFRRCHARRSAGAWGVGRWR